VDRTATCKVQSAHYVGPAVGVPCPAGNGVVDDGGPDLRWRRLGTGFGRGRGGGGLTKVKTSAGAYLPRSAVAPNKIMGVRAANIDLSGKNG
jgi:hypothetical protein